MLEYFTYKKVKKHRAQKEAEREAKDEASSRQGADNSHQHHRRHDEHGSRHDGKEQASPVLRPEDETFLEELLACADGPAPPLPPRAYTFARAAELDGPSAGDEAAAAPSPSPPPALDHDGPSLPRLSPGAKTPAADQPAAKKPPGRLALLFTRSNKKDGGASEQGLEPEGNVPAAEGAREANDLGNVLDRLNLSAQNNKVVSSTDSSQLLQSFTQVFKDLVNGVPTACDDLARLIDDRDGALSRGFDKLPASLKRLVTQLPDKITQNLGPEILAAAAAKSQGIKADAAAGLKGTAKKVFMPTNLAELVTKPGAIVGMLRAIVEVLKTRWPAFIGVNVLWSVALSRECPRPFPLSSAAPGAQR